MAFCVPSGAKEVRAPVCAKPVIDLNFTAGSVLAATHKHLKAGGLDPVWRRTPRWAARAASEGTEKLYGRRTMCPQVLEGLSRSASFGRWHVGVRLPKEGGSAHREGSSSV